MKIEFSRPSEEEGTPGTAVATARWVDGKAEVTDVGDDAARDAVTKIFRETPVLVDDGALRTLSGHGPSLVQPGSLEWFRAAAQVRGKEAGLAVRFEPDVRRGEGWDPASRYTHFREAAGR